MDNTWYSHLASVVSLGAQHKGVNSLAELHEARAEHLSQFFTPADVVAFIWRIVSPAMDAAIRDSRGFPVAILDNSMGSGRMFQFADPKKHELAGFDIHAESVDAVTAATKAAGFRTDFIVGGMQEVNPRGFGVALINPPFSIHLESPHMEDYPCCAFGKFGPGTACLSHQYAVAQALDAAGVVAAVLPTSFAETLAADQFFSSRLHYIGRLPGNAFVSEGANVSTSIAVWDSEPSDEAICFESISNLRAAVAPALALTCRTERDLRAHSLSRAGIDLANPTILTPVTGNRTVRVVRHNRRVILKFACGLTEAKVMNAILRAAGLPSSEHRYPAGVRFAGEGALDLQLHLMQEEPVESFQSLVDGITSAGGEPDVDPGIWGYLRRQARRIARHVVPFAHTIRAEGAQLVAGADIELVARDSFVLNPTKWGSPVVKKGAKLTAQRAGAGRWTVQAGGLEWSMTDEEINRRFEVLALKDANGSAWVEKFPGRLKAFPALAHDIGCRIEALDIGKWLNWDYQTEDLAEVAISPYGCVVGWDMGLGKTRLAIALCLLGGSKHNLHVTEAHLVPEVVLELQQIGLPEFLWRVIDSPEALADLRRINIISYNRLRQPVTNSRKGVTYGKALRRRIGTMIADEGHSLRNIDTEQTRAAWSVAARRRYVFTGTVVPNYARDTLAILAWVAGSATAAQPYGIRSGAFLEPRLVTSMNLAKRGVDAFRSDYVSLEWITNEFKEDMQSGAKREIPRIANLPKYRAMLAPLVKRRVSAEPAVARHFQIPSPVETVIPVPWDNRHLSFYLDVAENFAAWYCDAKRKADDRKGNLNLIALLARIGAVETACNIPQAGVEGFGGFGGLTTKQEFAAEHVAQLARDGHKIIVYVHRPHLLAIMERELLAKGIRSVSIHGGRDIEERTQDLRENFRFGVVPVLLATLGCVQTGLNLPEATRIVYLSRSWTAKTERQANARALRPQQKKVVAIDYIHLPGSIDDYQAQMVAFKGDAADSGLDWATPQKSNAEFAHLDTILGRFVENIAALRGMTGTQLRDQLARRVA